MGASHYFRRRIAVPQEHGAWVFLLLPLVVGLVAGGRLSSESIYLTVAGLAVFFMRQPILAITKVRAGRRPASDLPVAWAWLTIYALVAGLHVFGLVLRGHAGVLWLGIPAAGIAAWHAWLVMHRAERRQVLMEILAAGALALAAPAAVIVARADASPRMLVVLWTALWLVSASMIACTHLRLVQRVWGAVPPAAERWWAARMALVLPGLGLALAGLAPRWLLPFGILLLEALLATWRPAVGARPKAIGMRQLLVSVLVAGACLLAVAR